MKTHLDKNRRPTRRDLLKTAAVSSLALPTILPRSVFGANDKINIAWVGFGNMGWGDLNNCAHGNNVVALCDCNPKEWVRAKKKFPDAKFFKDFRVMLREMGDQIDAVGVGTPDHTHFAIAYMAMSMGNPDGQSRPRVRRRLPDQGMGRRRADRRCHRSDLVDQPPGQRLGFQRQGQNRLPQRRTASRRHGLGPLARTQPRKGRTLPRHPPDHLAPLVALRLRRTRRHRLPHHRSTPRTGRSTWARQPGSTST